MEEGEACCRPCSEESVLRLSQWEQQAVTPPLDGLVWERDEVSGNIKRSGAVQTQQPKLNLPADKTLHCTCVNCSSLGTEGHCCLPCLHLLEISLVWDKSPLTLL